MCRTVYESAATLQVPHARIKLAELNYLEVIVDPAFAPSGPQNYLDCIDSEGLKGERLGLAVELLEYADDEVSLLRTMSNCQIQLGF
jgi:hypothetical protein